MVERGPDEMPFYVEASNNPDPKEGAYESQGFDDYTDAIVYAEKISGGPQNRFIWMMEWGRYERPMGGTDTDYIYFWWTPNLEDYWGRVPDGRYGYANSGPQSLVSYEPLCR